MNKRHLKTVHTVLTAIMISAGLYLAFLYAPTERTMGDVQRIFYFHVPSAWIGFFAFAVTAFGSIMFLVKKDLKWDSLSAASAEIGLLFTTLGLITGMLWAKPVWGIYWTWDARLTSAFVLWLIYASLLLMRSYIPQETKRAYLSSVVGIIGFIDVPIVFFSIRWWRTQHPSAVLAGGEGSGLAPEMLFTLIFCVFAFTMLYSLILRKRLGVVKAQQEIDLMYKTLENK